MNLKLIPAAILLQCMLAGWAAAQTLETPPADARAIR